MPWSSACHQAASVVFVRFRCRPLWQENHEGERADSGMGVALDAFAVVQRWVVFCPSSCCAAAGQMPSMVNLKTFQALVPMLVPQVEPLATSETSSMQRVLQRR
eukprot:3524373-Amphidinium_carterae.1